MTILLLTVTPYHLVKPLLRQIEFLSICFQMDRWLSAPIRFSPHANTVSSLGFLPVRPSAAIDSILPDSLSSARITLGSAAIESTARIDGDGHQGLLTRFAGGETLTTLGHVISAATNRAIIIDGHTLTSGEVYSDEGSMPISADSHGAIAIGSKTIDVFGMASQTGTTSVATGPNISTGKESASSVATPHIGDVIWNGLERGTGKGESTILTDESVHVVVVTSTGSGKVGSSTTIDTPTETIRGGDSRQTENAGRNIVPGTLHRASDISTPILWIFGVIV